MLIGQYQDYREYLRDELARRSQASSQYSLRAFARDLTLSPQTLSAVLSAKKNISPELGVKVSNRLKHSLKETSYFHDLIELSQARSEGLKEIIRFRLSRYDENHAFREIQADVYQIVADWYHNGILELVDTEGFRNDPTWIASRLGVSPSEASAALKRLLKSSLLVESRGTLKRTSANLTTTQDIPSAALKKATEQFLEKAQKALQDQSVDERDFGTITMAVDPAKLVKAKKMIREFRRELSKMLETGKKTEVYTFSTQLFKVTQSTMRKVK